MIRFLISVLYFIFVSTGVFAQALNKQSYVEYGESYLSQPWHALSRQSFARFKTDATGLSMKDRYLNADVIWQLSLWLR